MTLNTYNFLKKLIAAQPPILEDRRTITYAHRTTEQVPRLVCCVPIGSRTREVDETKTAALVFKDYPRKGPETDDTCSRATHPDGGSIYQLVSDQEFSTPAQLGEHWKEHFLSHSITPTQGHVFVAPTFDERYCQVDKSKVPKYTYTFAIPDRPTLDKNDRIVLNAPDVITLKSGTAYTHTRRIGQGVNGAIHLYESSAGNPRKIAIKIPKETIIVEDYLDHKPSDHQLASLSKLTLQQVLDEYPQRESANYRHQVEDLEREAKLVGKKAPGIVFPIDAGTFTVGLPGCSQTAEVPFVAQPYVDDAQTVQELIQETLPINQIQLILRQSLERLIQMSDLRVAHHDITAINVLIQKQMQHLLSVIDFGCSSDDIPATERDSHEPQRYTLTNAPLMPPREEAIEDEFGSRPEKAPGVYTHRRHDRMAMGGLALTLLLRLNFMQSQTNYVGDGLQQVAPPHTGDPINIREFNHQRLFSTRTGYLNQQETSVRFYGLIQKFNPDIPSEILLSLSEFLSIWMDPDTFRGEMHEGETRNICERLLQHPFLTTDWGDYEFTSDELRRDVQESQSMASGYYRTQQSERRQQVQSVSQGLVSGYYRTPIEQPQDIVVVPTRSNEPRDIASTRIESTV